jgi:hypothetical protein
MFTSKNLHQHQVYWVALSTYKRKEAVQEPNHPNCAPRYAPRATAAHKSQIELALLEAWYFHELGVSAVFHRCSLV